jgi:aminobenzoyl-glutamate utilization protein B
VVLWLRDWKRSEVEDLLARARKIADGAALMTETRTKFTVDGGSWEVLVNDPGERLLDRNMRAIGQIVYTEEEQNFARAIQKATGVAPEGMAIGFRPLEGQEPGGGSTDVGDVSWVLPTLHLSVATSPIDAPWHAWPVVATAGMSIGHKGLVLAAKTLAASMVDLYEQPPLITDIQSDFKKKKGDIVYKSYVPDGPPPVPKD